MQVARVSTALLVDDEPASRMANQVRLRDQGYLVLMAQDATEALGHVKRSAPNVIFVHVARGNLSLMQALRADDSCRHIPVVLMHDHRDARLERTKLRTVLREGW